jgi:hypothetical protein
MSETIYRGNITAEQNYLMEFPEILARDGDFHAEGGY